MPAVAHKMGARGPGASASHRMAAALHSMARPLHLCGGKRAAGAARERRLPRPLSGRRPRCRQRQATPGTKGWPMWIWLKRSVIAAVAVAALIGVAGGADAAEKKSFKIAWSIYV